jgi:hypothetical protein
MSAIGGKADIHHSGSAENTVLNDPRRLEIYCATSESIE